MDDTAMALASMFEGDGSEPGYLSGVGWKPWWPMAGRVWDSRGVCPETDAYKQRDWAEVWALLQRLHSEYLEAKKS